MYILIILKYGGSYKIFNYILADNFEKSHLYKHQFLGYCKNYLIESQ